MERITSREFKGIAVTAMLWFEVVFVFAIGIVLIPLKNNSVYQMLIDTLVLVVLLVLLIESRYSFKYRIIVYESHIRVWRRKGDSIVLQRDSFRIKEINSKEKNILLADGIGAEITLYHNDVDVVLKFLEEIVE